jgi:hypothetical protein
MKALKQLGLLFLGLVAISATLGSDDGEFEAQVNTLKQDCKNLIKSSRYEGSKVTYFTAGKKQTKSIELFMFLANEYQIAIGGKKCTPSLTIKIYDAAADVEDRTLIKEYKSMQGKNTVISSTELNTIYRKKVPQVERLKNIHIEYSIGSGKSAKEAIVLVYGHKA